MVEMVSGDKVTVYVELTPEQWRAGFKRACAAFYRELGITPEEAVMRIAPGSDGGKLVDIVYELRVVRVVV